jgi:hypothetical protein
VDFPIVGRDGWICFTGPPVPSIARALFRRYTNILSGTKHLSGQLHHSPRIVGFGNHNGLATLHM